MCLLYVRLFVLLKNDLLYFFPSESPIKVFRNIVKLHIFCHWICVGSHWEVDLNWRFVIVKTLNKEIIIIIYSEVNKAIGLLRKLHNALTRLPLLTIHKSFIRPRFDYGDIIYDQTYTVSFHQKIESVQYNWALAITGAIRGTSKEKLYQELGLETLSKRRW